MEGVLSPQVGSTQVGSFDLNYSKTSIKLSDDQLIIEKTLLSASSDRVSVSPNDLVKSLSITAKQILEKLNELLKGKIPEGGIEKLNPDEYTPEKTAERIVNGATGFYGVFEKQNPNLSKEELLDKFMETIRGGIETGYSQAYSTLKDIGAFGVPGVQEGVEKTKALIEEKLKAFEAFKRKELGLDPVEDQTVEENIVAPSQTEILAQGGVGTLNLTV